MCRSPESNRGSVQSDYLVASGLGALVPGVGLAVSASRVLVASGGVLYTFKGASDGGFLKSTIHDGGGSGYGDLTKIVFDAQGKAHVVIRDAQAAGFNLLHLQELDDGGFSASVVEDGGRVGNPAFDLRVAGDGTVHVAYYLSNLVPLDGGARSDLAIRHAQLTPTGWSYGLVKRTGNYGAAAYQNFGYRLSMGIDPTGEPVIAFQDEAVGTGADGGGNGLTVATRSGGVGGNWSLETVGPYSAAGFEQIALDVNPVAGAGIQAALVQLIGSPTYFAKTAAGWQRLGFDAGYTPFLATPAVRFAGGTGWFYGIATSSPFGGNLVGYSVSTQTPSIYSVGKAPSVGFSLRTNPSVFLPVTHAPGSSLPHWISAEGDGNLNYRWSYSTRQ